MSLSAPDSSAASPYSDYQPMLPAARRDPYPYYRWLRDEAPVRFIPEVNAYAISRNDDVRQVLLNHERFSSDPLIGLAFGEGNPAGDARYLLASDPPEHTRLRSLVNSAFSRRNVVGMQNEIRQTIKRCLERLEGREEFDFIHEFASPLPVTIIADMLGIEADRHADFRRWSNSVTAGGNGAALSEMQLKQIRADAAEFRDYFLARIASARRQPGEDLISALVSAEEQGQRLSAEEVLAMSVLLLIAGNETTTTLLSNALLCLRDFPAQEALVRGRRELVPNLVEETLRFLSPVQLLFRRTTADTELHGVRIRKDELVMPMYGSANRDERTFVAPERFDVERGDLRKHMAFGWGIHMCVGRALSLLEGEIALNALFDHYRTITVTTPEIDWLDAFFLRGPKRLPVRVMRH